MSAVLFCLSRQPVEFLWSTQYKEPIEPPMERTAICKIELSSFVSNKQGGIQGVLY